MQISTLRPAYAALEHNRSEGKHGVSAKIFQNSLRSRAILRRDSFLRRANGLASESLQDPAGCKLSAVIQGITENKAAFSPYRSGLPSVFFDFYPLFGRYLFRRARAIGNLHMVMPDWIRAARRERAAVQKRARWLSAGGGSRDREGRTGTAGYAHPGFGGSGFREAGMALSTPGRGWRRHTWRAVIWRRRGVACSYAEGLHTRAPGGG